MKILRILIGFYLTSLDRVGAYRIKKLQRQLFNQRKKNLELKNKYEQIYQEVVKLNPTYKDVAHDSLRDV
jgi:cell division protein FtsB